MGRKWNVVCGRRGFVVPCRVLGWCGWAAISGLRFDDPDAELRERLRRRTVKSLSMAAWVGVGWEGRGTTGRALLVAHFWVGELLTGHQWGWEGSSSLLRN